MHEELANIINDLPEFSKYLKIVTKSNGIAPFVFNAEQLLLHNFIENQIEKEGKARIIILKARQLGISTYVAARLFVKTMFKSGVRTFILTHLSDTTDNLFGMVKCFYEHLPEPLKVPVKSDNRRNLLFESINSGYKVGTAGSVGVGVGGTLRYFHGSEVARWANPKEHVAGIMESIPGGDGTEIILESTAFDIGNYFHEKWNDAVDGRSEYKPFFLGWNQHLEYKKSYELDFALTEEEDFLSKTYNLSKEQILWRRSKISEMGRDGEWRFKREYPINPEEAFSTPVSNSVILPQYIIAASKCTAIQKNGPRIIGIDPAWEGDDKTVIIKRQGATFEILGVMEGKDTSFVYGQARSIILKFSQSTVVIDKTGMPGVYDLLKNDDSIKVSARVIGINFAEKAKNSDRYANKRAEMYFELAEFLEKNHGIVNIPDNSMLIKELMSIQYQFDNKGRFRLIDKSLIKSKLGHSPDFADAIALTFCNDSVFNAAKIDRTPFQAKISVFGK